MYEESYGSIGVYHHSDFGYDWFCGYSFFICDARTRGVELPGWVVIFGIMSTITFDIVFIFNVCYIWDLIWGEKKEEQKNNTSTYKF